MSTEPAASSGPITALFQRLRDLALGRSEDNGTLRETLEELLEDRDDKIASLNEHERRLLLNALSFGELQVADVMVPRSDIQAVEKTATLDETIAGMRMALHTRLPVFNETLDNVIGMVHIKDLLVYWGDGEDFDLQGVVRKVLHVPPSMRVVDLLLQMRDSRVHMAIVVDEYGGTDGLATIDDLIEEIVGEIQDEHDRILPPQIVEHPDGCIEADARVDLEELEQRLNMTLLDAERRDDADTLGGLVFMLLDRVPARGEVITHPAGLTVEVVDADPRRVKRLRLRREKVADGDSE